MSINVDYKLMAECSEEDLLEKLHRIRGRLLSLPLRQVGLVTKLDPVYQTMIIRGARWENLLIPPIVEARLKQEGEVSTEVRQMKGRLGMIHLTDFPKPLRERFLKPSIEFAKTSDLWNLADSPEEMELHGLRATPSSLATEFAKVLLCYGYGIGIDVGPGCDLFNLCLCTYRNFEAPLWLGWGFVDTHYSENFKQAHDAVCRALDIVKDEGLLMFAADVCKYYEHREWSRSMKFVNRELDFTWLVGNVIGEGLRELAGIGEDYVPVVNNAATVRPPWKADRSDDAGQPDAGGESAEHEGDSGEES